MHLSIFVRILILIVIFSLISVGFLFWSRFGNQNSITNNKNAVAVNLTSSSFKEIKYKSNQDFENDFKMLFPQVKVINAQINKNVPANKVFSIKYQESQGIYEFNFSYDEETMNIDLSLLSSEVTEEGLSSILAKIFYALAIQMQSDFVPIGNSEEKEVREEFNANVQEALDRNMIKSRVLVDFNP